MSNHITIITTATATPITIPNSKEPIMADSTAGNTAPSTISKRIIVAHSGISCLTILI